MGIAVDPLLHVDWLQFLSEQIRESSGEEFQSRLIPDVGFCRSVFLNPLEELVNNRNRQ